MSLPVYSFFPWLRQGLGNLITDPDQAGRTELRSQIPVALQLSSTGPAGPLNQQVPASPRNVPLAGPGDIVGFDTRNVVRTEPRNWITGFEPNHLPFIEFYDEDFPWRYTPAAANTASHRLRPWIALVVLQEGVEFEEGGAAGDRPLPHILVSNPAAFSPADQLWAWAHVHVNRAMTDSVRAPALGAAGDPAVTTALQRLGQTLTENADLAYSRLVCPRKLADNTPYHAFVVPVFETGRLAGLGHEPSAAPEAMQSAWAAYSGKQEPTLFPYYYRWYFRTGSVGDFEYLVRLLKPRKVDKRVGTRDIDVQSPDANLPGITDPALAGVLKLGGALKVPRRALSDDDWEWLQKYENWDAQFPRPFQQKLADFINLADDYQTATAPAANQGAGVGATAGDEDPLITPPLYGEWHALQQRLIEDRDGTPLETRNWLHDLNLDPRHRASAAFGTRVIQQKQEELMNAAWEQVGDVLEAQRRIRIGQLLKQVATTWHLRQLTPLSAANPERAMAISAPVFGRIMGSPLTVAHLVRKSPLPQAALSAPMRRIVRPRARLVKALPLAATGKPSTLLRRLNAREVSAAPPRLKPQVVSPSDVTAKLEPQIPPWTLRALRRWPWLVWVLPLALLLVALLLLFVLPAAAAAIAAVAVGLFALLRKWNRARQGAEAADDTVATRADVDLMPKVPGFTLADVGQDPAPATGGTDSTEGTSFKNALRDVRTLVSDGGTAAVTGVGAPPKPLAFSTIASTVMAALHPAGTVPNRVLNGLKVPPRLEPTVTTEEFREPFAYPVFDMPMYKPLADQSAELFLPNLNLIPQNSITLLTSNQAFIEAYMVGLNHEMARELLWREYPTDQRGSYFRQFWDVSAFLDPNPASNTEDQKERLRDITKLHTWAMRSPPSRLGSHNNRDVTASTGESLVLTIRGELLKKYPNAVIYAHRAQWQMKNGTIDPSQERILAPLTPAQEDAPPRSIVRTPLFEAKVDPDLFFFGFDLTDVDVIGGTGDNPTDDPGWFFVIKERPGEPRFGLDVEAPASADIAVWSDLGWDNVQPSPAGAFISIDPAMNEFTVRPPQLSQDQEKVEQHNDDVAIRWDRNMNAADVAYVLFRAPVLVAVHGAEMFKDQP